MKYRFWSISALAVTLFLPTLQTSTSAQMPDLFKSATGMSKSQITIMENSLVAAQSKAMAGAKITTSVTSTRTTTKWVAEGTTKCSAGGYIRSTMTTSIVGTISASPKVWVDGSGHQTISNWKCVTGWIVNGDPSINRLINGSAFSYIDVRYYLSGGWKATGPSKQKQSCQTSGNWHYTSIGSSGVSNVHISCVPGIKTDINIHWNGLSKAIPVPIF